MVPHKYRFFQNIDRLKTNLFQGRLPPRQEKGLEQVPVLVLVLVLVPAPETGSVLEKD